jgi:hypothetical protein
MAWVVPFYAGVLAAAVGAYLLALALRRRHLPWREVGLAAATGSGALPVVAYNAWAFTTNPALAALSAQNQIPSPHPLHYLLGFLLFLVPAVWGTAHVLKLREERWLLPIAWVAIVPLLVYVPLNVQRRMIAGAQVPLALLAATGLVGWFRGRRRALAGYVAVTTLSTWLLVFGNLAPIAHRNEPIYRPGGEVAALRWLDTHTRAGDIALASFEVGNVIPAYTDLRVFAGHGPETLDNQAKREALQRFFQAGTDDAWRRDLLAESSVDYLFYGPHEAQLGAWDPDRADYLTLRFRAGDYAIYAVDVEEVDR